MTPASDSHRPARSRERASFQAVERNPAYLQVAEQLRTAITEGRLVPGDELPTERDLATQFGVSRTTVREALRALQAQGFVRSAGAAPMRSVVSDNPGLLGRAYDELIARDEVTILDMIPFRGMLELAAIERAVLDDVPGALDEVRAAAQRVGRSEGDELFPAYLEFHLALVRASGNRALLLTMEAVQGAMRAHLAEAISTVMTAPDTTWTAARLGEVYTGIVEALEGRDADRAGDLLLTHMADLYNAAFLGSAAHPTIDGA